MGCPHSGQIFAPGAGDGPSGSSIDLGVSLLSSPHREGENDVVVVDCRGCCWVLRRCRSCCTLAATASSNLTWKPSHCWYIRST